MKKNFLKNAMKTAGPKAGKAALRAGGTVGVLAGHQMLTSPRKDGKPAIVGEKMAKVLPWVYLGFGIIAESLAPDQGVWSFAGAGIGGGLTNGGALLATAQLMGENKGKIGLAGIGEATTGTVVQMQPVDASLMATDWAKALRETQEMRETPSAIPADDGNENGVNGVYDPAPSDFALAGAETNYLAVA